MCDARTTAPESVVVERGQVVVDEGERVDELDRSCGRQQLLRLRACRLARRQAQHRTDPLAATLQRIAHRVGQPGQLAGESKAPDVAPRRGRGARPASALRVGLAARLLELGLDLLGDLGQLGEHVDRLLAVAAVASRRARVSSRRSSSSSARFSDVFGRVLMPPSPSRSGRGSRSRAALPRRTRSASRARRPR